MTLNIGSSMALNTGSYYGSGYSSSYGNGSTRIRSASNLNATARNLAAAYSSKMQLVEYYLNSGDSEQALNAFELIMEDAKKNYGSEYSDSTIESTLNDAFQKRTGASFMDTTSSKTHSPLAAGFLQGIPLLGLMADSNSTDEAMAKTVGKSVKPTKQVLEVLGAAASGAATGAAAGCLTCVPFGPVVGAIGGALIGGVQVICKNLFNI